MDKLKLYSNIVDVICLMNIFSTSTTGHYTGNEEQLQNKQTPKVLLISFDGFRWDYLDKAKAAGYNTTNFDYLIENGVQVDKPGITNTFVTKTCPNHYSMATGMYEETHGVVGNTMYDPESKRNFTLQSEMDMTDAYWFNNGTDSNSTQVDPIWNRNQMSGGTTGVCYWPGSEAPVSGQLPHYYEHYSEDGLMSNESRIDTVIGWFTKGDESNKTKTINLGLMYFNQPDETGHAVGPESDHMMNLISKLDDLVGYLIRKLKENDLFDKLNVIITSDHGMANKKFIIEMDNHIEPDLYTNYGSSPIWNILPTEGKEEEVLEKLKSVPNIHVYKKEDIPREYHYTYNSRILPILVEAEENYTLCHNLVDGTCTTGGGLHGYNNSLESMRPIFIAHGPAFKKNFTAKPFRNVDIYPLLCRLLHIDPPNNLDGELAKVSHILLQRMDEELLEKITTATIAATVTFSTLLAVIWVCCALRTHISYKSSPPRRYTLLLDDVNVHSQKGLLHHESEEDDVFYSDNKNRKNKR